MTEKIYEQGGVETSTTNFVFGLDIEQATRVIRHQSLKQLAGVLATAIGVMQQRIGLARRRSSALWIKC